MRNLEAESIKSRTESMGGCVKLKTTCVRKVLYEKGAVSRASLGNLLGEKEEVRSAGRRT